VLWFSVWLVLVLLTLAGAALLGRRLWRSGKALLSELEKAAAVTERLERLQVELAERFPAPMPPRPDLDAGPAERARLHDLRNEYRAGVHRRRRARLARASRHWRSLTSPPAGAGRRRGAAPRR
jgi:hypothetical protein